MGGIGRVSNVARVPQPREDVWVDFEGHEWAGIVLKVETSGYLLCRIHVDDPEWDFGSASGRVMPQQIVAVRSGHVRPRTEPEPEPDVEVKSATWGGDLNALCRDKDGNEIPKKSA